MTAEVARPHRRRRAWTVALAVVAVAALVVALMVSLVVQGSSEGTSAIRHAQEATAVELARAGKRFAAEGSSLKVRWSAVPSPAGGGHAVTARLELEPAGGLSEALFAVSGTQVSPQNSLASRLLGDAAR